MDSFVYHAPTKFVFGRGAEARVGELAREAGGSRALIVYGGGSAVRSGLLSRVATALADAGVATCQLGGIKPNPTDDRVREGIALARSQAVDMVVAVGGGSVIDTAKAIALGVPYDGDFWDFYCGRQTPRSALPVGVVLTIPAAGSEGSGNSVITLVPASDGTVATSPTKLSLRTEMVLRPKFAVMNPELTMTLPAWQTACGIVDMMAHIFERYFTPTPDCEVTDRVAEGVLKAILTEAPKVMANPGDYQPRANIMWAATLAHNGICGTGRREDWASHFIEHEISALYPHVAHGAGLAAVIPAWMTWVARTNPARVAQLAQRVMDVDPAAMKTDSEVAAEGIARLRRFFKSLAMPASFAELGIDNPDIPTLVEALHLHKGEPIGGYVPLYRADTAAIYAALL